MKFFGVLFAIMAIVFTVVCGMSTGANLAVLKEGGKSGIIQGPPGGPGGPPPPGSPPGPPPSTNSTS